MLSAVDYIHERYWQHILSSEKLIEGNFLRDSRASCARKAHSKNCICAEPCLVVRSVKLNHELVNILLLPYIHSGKLFCYYIVDIVHCILDSLAHVSFCAVPELNSLMDACRGSAGNSLSCKELICVNINLYCRIAPGIKNLPCLYLCYLVQR